MDQPIFPWDKQHRETANRYAYFLAYLDLGPGKRSYSAVARAIGKPYETIARAAKDWNWKERATKYDMWMQFGETEHVRGVQATMQQATIKETLDDAALLRELWLSVAQQGGDLTAQDVGRLITSRKAIDDMRRRAVGLPATIKGMPEEDDGDDEWAVTPTGTHRMTDGKASIAAALAPKATGSD